MPGPLLAQQQARPRGRGWRQSKFFSRLYHIISVIHQVYLFEDAELKTIFNMAELITELEPEPLIDQENKDPNAGEEKRKIISQNVNLIFGPLFIVRVLSSFLFDHKNVW